MVGGGENGLRSVKTNLGSFRTGFFGFCSKADMTKC